MAMVLCSLEKMATFAPQTKKMFAYEVKTEQRHIGKKR